MKARFACGSVVRFDLFPTFLHIVQKCWEKDGLFRPAGGEIHLQMENCVRPVTIDYYYSTARRFGTCEQL